MKFLEINNIDDMLPAIEGKKEISVRTGEDGHTTIVYQFMDSTTFDSIPSLEARGIMFNDFGQVISRPLHKFHNLDATHSGINSYTRDYILANKDRVVAIYEKLDGSMISTANYNGTVRLRSKKAFNTDVCKLAQKIYDRDREIQSFCKMCVEAGLTATFELTHPEARIVLDYKEPKLRLLHVRNNVTGEYMYMPWHNFVPAIYRIEGCPTLPLDMLETIMSTEHLENLKDTEGYVIQFDDGDMVKIKCPWYVSLHKTVTFLRERDIAELVLDERLDDVYAALDKLGIDTKAVEHIETEIKNELISIQEQTETLWLFTRDMERKQVALRYRDDPTFGLMMNLRDGKEPDYNTYYKRRILKDRWSLKQVGNVGEKE